MQFVDTPRPKRSNEDMAIGGVVPIRSRSRSRAQKSSFDLYQSGEIEDAKDEDAGLRNPNDYKR